MRNSVRKLTSLLPAIAWALLIILTAFVFKGTSMAAPLVAGMTGVAFTLVVLQPRKFC